MQFTPLVHALVNNNPAYPVCRIPITTWFSDQDAQRKVRTVMQRILKGGTQFTCNKCRWRLEIDQ